SHRYAADPLCHTWRAAEPPDRAAQGPHRQPGQYQAPHRAYSRSSRQGAGAAFAAGRASQSGRRFGAIAALPRARARRNHELRPQSRRDPIAMTAAQFAIALLSIAAALCVVMAGAWLVQQRTGNSGWVDTAWTF